MNPASSVLILEDEPLVTMDLEAMFEEHGVPVLLAGSTGEALRIIQAESPGAAVLDYLIQKGDCALVAAALRERNTPFIVFSGADPESLPDIGAKAFIGKPSPPEAIVRAVLALIGKGAEVA